MNVTNGERPGEALPTPLMFPSDKALAPFRKEIAESGMTDDKLLKFFEEVREEVYQEKHEGRSQARLFPQVE